MSEALVSVVSAGPYVSIQDGGRPRLMRYGVPESGPMDRLAFAAANAAIGNIPDTPGIEISIGGVTLNCRAGTVSFAVSGGGFEIELGDQKRDSWSVNTLHAGEILTIRSGVWGSWCYLVFAGDLQVHRWLESASTHGMSGFGGGSLKAGQQLVITDPQQRQRREGRIPFPHVARPRSNLRVTMGPQERFFKEATIAAFSAQEWRMTSAWDRMGVRLGGPRLPLTATLDMPSEPITRGTVQIAGDGVPTILLADHPTTGGYPKLATVLDCDLDALMQLRLGDHFRFLPVSSKEATEIARNVALEARTYLTAIGR